MHEVYLETTLETLSLGGDVVNVARRSTMEGYRWFLIDSRETVAGWLHRLGVICYSPDPLGAVGLSTSEDRRCC